MEVTKDNFAAVVPGFVRLLQECDFYSVDFEMTGINGPVPAKPACPFGRTVTDAFDEKNHAAQTYCVIQMGVCLFTRVDARQPPSDKEPTTKDGDDDVEDEAPRDEEPEKGMTAAPTTTTDMGEYEIHAFNFYHFPSDGRNVTMNGPTVSDFLASHGMDFTKWITKGIGCVTVERRAASATCKHGPDATTATTTATSATTAPALPDKMAKADESAFATLRSRVAAILGGGGDTSSSTGESKNTKSSNKTGAGKKGSGNNSREMPYFQEKESFAQATAYLRSCGLSTQKEGNRHVIRAASAAAKSTRGGGGSGAAAAAAGFDVSHGLTVVFDAMVAARKPLVGHNAMADWLFLYYMFHTTPLASLAEFRAFMRRSFPCVFDTRHLALRPAVPFDPFVTDRLDALHTHFRTAADGAVRFRFPAGFEQLHPETLKHSGRGAHEAAYDAFTTGALFLFLQAVASPAAILAEANRVAVHPSLWAFDISAASASADPAVHSGLVLWLSAPTPRSDSGHAAFNRTRVDGALKGLAGLRGRTLFFRNHGIVFCPGPVEAATLPQSLAKLTERLTTAAGADVVVRVLCTSEGEIAACARE